MTRSDAEVPAYPLRPVQFSRLTRRGIMLGLSLPQLIVLGLAVLFVVAGLYLAGGMGLLVTSPVWATCARLAAVPAGGRKLIEWVPVVSRWAFRTYFGQLLYRRRVIKPRPAGTLALPGDAAALREWEDPETGAAMIHDPHAQTLTAILGVTHPAFVLLDPGEQQRRVTGRGRVLASACRSGRIARVQVSERTLPDSAPGWRSGGAPTAPTTAPGPRPPTASSSTGPVPPANATPPPSASPWTRRPPPGRSRPPAAGCAGLPR